MSNFALARTNVGKNRLRTYEKLTELYGMSRKELNRKGQKAKIL